MHFKIDFFSSKLGSIGKYDLANVVLSEYMFFLGNTFSKTGSKFLNLSAI